MPNRIRILLLGGTSETAPLATKLAAAGYAVLVSTATDAALEIGGHPAIRRRCGRLNEEQLAALLREQELRAIVDATHPYADEAHRVSSRVAAQTQRPYLRFQRRPALAGDADRLDVADHRQAAQCAAAIGKPILLTIGSRHLAPYVAAAAQQRVPLFARVLDHPESRAACDRVGLAAAGRIFGRGPFSLEENRALIRRHRIGVVVTKDSGHAGGVREKQQAAHLECCRLIVVQPPPETEHDRFTSMDELVEALLCRCPLH